MKKIIPILLLSSLIAACAHNPIPKDYTGPTATINDSYTNKTSTSAHYFILEKVNGKHVKNSWGETRSDNYGRGKVFDPSIVARQVPTTKQTFTIKALKFFPTDIQSMFGDEMATSQEITFTPAAREVYTVRGELSKQGSKVRLERSDGTVVTSE